MNWVVFCACSLFWGFLGVFSGYPSRFWVGFFVCFWFVWFMGVCFCHVLLLVVYGFNRFSCRAFYAVHRFWVIVGLACMFGVD